MFLSLFSSLYRAKSKVYLRGLHSLYNICIAQSLDPRFRSGKLKKKENISSPSDSINMLSNHLFSLRQMRFVPAHTASFSTPSSWSQERRMPPTTTPAVTTLSERSTSTLCLTGSANWYEVIIDEGPDFSHAVWSAENPVGCWASVWWDDWKPQCQIKDFILTTKSFFLVWK